MTSAINFAILNSDHARPAKESIPSEDDRREIQKMLEQIKAMRPDEAIAKTIAMREVLERTLIEKGLGVECGKIGHRWCLGAGGQAACCPRCQHSTAGGSASANGP